MYLKCPVCNTELERIDNTYKCANNHSYDISRKGFTNLLLANQGHSHEEGDKLDMVLARERFLSNGHYECLRSELIKIISRLSESNSDLAFADIACGEGYYTNEIHRVLSNTLHISTAAVDISKAAINRSSIKKNALGLKNIDYFIGNLDYLPFIDNSFDILLNCFAPINEIEFARVTKDNGYYIRVLPNIYHLYELKEFLYPEVHLNEPKENEMSGFNLVEENEVNDTITINNQEIQDLFTMTPYYYKTSYEAKERLKNLQTLTTRISFIIKVYKRKGL